MEQQFQWSDWNGRMNPDVVAALLTWISLFIAAAAAGLWLKAARIIVRSDDLRSKGTVFMEGVDVRSTASEQTRWNSRAAIATAGALLAQAISQAISNWGLVLDLVG